MLELSLWDDLKFVLEWLWTDLLSIIRYCLTSLQVFECTLMRFSFNDISQSSWYKRSESFELQQLFRTFDSMSILKVNVRMNVSVFKSYNNFFRSVTMSAIVEIMIFELAMLDDQSKSFFVKVFENEKMNFELCLNSIDLIETSIDRLLSLLKRSTHLTNILLDDSKNVIVIHDRCESRYWHFQLSNAQIKNSQFLIIVSVADSHIVALFLIVW